MWLSRKLTNSTVLLVILLFLYCLTDTNIYDLMAKSLNKKENTILLNIFSGVEKLEEKSQLLNSNFSYLNLTGKHEIHSITNKIDRLKSILKNIQRNMSVMALGGNSKHQVNTAVKKNSVPVHEQPMKLHNESKTARVKGIGNCVPWVRNDVGLHPTMIVSFPGSGNSFLRYLIIQATGKSTKEALQQNISDANIFVIDFKLC